MDRANIVHGNFLRRVAANELPTGAAPKSGLDPYTAVEIYRAQLTSRALDITSRRMQKEGWGFTPLVHLDTKAWLQLHAHCAPMTLRFCTTEMRRFNWPEQIK